jgi:penicillin-binding protein 1A
VFSIFLVGAAGFVWIWWAPCQLGGCVPVEDLAEYHAEGSEIVDRNGEPFARLATVDRHIVSLDSLPAWVPQAFIAIEDQRFYSHGGMDLFRTGGALLNNLKSGRVGEGGSTITQQLARNLFPDWLPYTERNLRRKVLEARAARQIERTFSKDKILELYLNHIYLGSGAYGIEAASRVYFDKPASELTVSEAAMLGGLPKAPSVINPKVGFERAVERRNLVLSQMVQAGYLDAEMAAAASEEPLRVVEADRDNPKTLASYFVDQVRRELEERVGHRFYTAGLRIHTAMDPDIQLMVEEELERQMTEIESGRYGEYHHPVYPGEASSGTEIDYLQSAAVVLDANSGEVLALVGGRDFRDSKFNRATQARRQAGSLFKPFVYAAALEEYHSPLHTIEDSPVQVTMPDGEIWRPRNAANEYDGTITLRDALVHSKNAATVRLALDVGIGSAIDIAQSLGITTPIPLLPSVALGTAEVRPIEITAAYAGFANGGHRVEPHLIREIVDRNGKVVWRAREYPEDVVDPTVAFMLTSILQDAVDRGTGTAVRTSGFTGAAAGKTGTTNEEADAWFVGYTPELVAGIWMGLDQPSTIVKGASGGALVAPLWGRLMSRIYASRPQPGPWPMPEGVQVVQVDRTTNYVINESCPDGRPTYREYFAQAEPPRPPCPVQNVAAPTMVKRAQPETPRVEPGTGSGAADPDPLALTEPDEVVLPAPAVEAVVEAAPRSVVPLAQPADVSPPSPARGAGPRPPAAPPSSVSGRSREAVEPRPAPTAPAVPPSAGEPDARLPESSADIPGNVAPDLSDAPDSEIPGEQPGGPPEEPSLPSVEPGATIPMDPDAGVLGVPTNEVL